MMKKGIRLLATAAIVTGTAASVLPVQSASAATQAVMVFSLPATVSNPLFLPGLGAEPTTQTTFSFGSEVTGTKACTAVHSVAGADENCELQANGRVNKGAANLGPYCGWSKGNGNVTKVNINGQNVLPASGVFIEWPQSAGTVLPLTYKAGSASGAVIGAGAVQTTGAAPGTCGINGGTRTFQVNGFSVLNG